MKCSTPSLLNLPDWWTPEQIREFQQGAVGAEINDRFYAAKG
jgi:hypothetical protein